MKRHSKNIIFLSLIIITLIFTSCNDMYKSYCDEILNFSYTENDTIIKNNIIIADKCSQKYHKDPVFFLKISQIYYLDAINDYSSQQLLSSASKLFLALDNADIYMSKINDIKAYDYQFRAEIYERLGDIYNNVNNLKQSSTLYNNALSDYESANNKDCIVNLLLKLGKLYQYNHIHDIAMIYFEMAEFYKTLSSTLLDAVDIYQIYNEMDVHCMGGTIANIFFSFIVFNIKDTILSIFSYS